MAEMVGRGQGGKGREGGRDRGVGERLTPFSFCSLISLVFSLNLMTAQALADTAIYGRNGREREEGREG